MSAPMWSNERRKLSALIPWPRNPRQIKGESVRRLQESFEEFGQPEVIAISPTNEVYNGHQRLKSWLAKFGDIEVDVRVSSRPLTEKERERLTVLLHRGAVGEWDFETLANEFEVDELLEWGFTEMELGLDGAAAGDADAEPQIDRAEELRQKWGVEPGDLWRVGEHRLICGDCTDAAVVERVMGGDVLDLIVTDPPYGVAYADKNKFLNAIAKGNRIQTHIEGDHGDLNAIAEELWRPAFQTMHDAAKEGAVIYCTSPQGGDQMMMMMMMQASFPVRHELIWIKNNHVLGRADYQYKHEPILYAWKGVGHKYYGGFQTSLIEVDKPQASKEHPTMKPVALFQKLIENSSLSGEIVGDWFIGSGTTMVACQNLGRRCRGIEIAPNYCAVVLQRMEDAFPGILIERVNDGG